MSRILRGVHVNALSAAWDFLKAARPSLVKVVNPDAAGLDELRRWVAPDVVIVRLTNDHQDLTPTPREAADRWWAQTRAKVAEIAPLITYLEVPVNEAHESNLAPFAEATARYVELAARENDVRCIVGNFSVGTPEPDRWHEFGPALEAAKRHNGAWGLHEYGLPNDMAPTWWVARSRRFVEATPASLRMPIFLTEFGIDGGLEKPPRPRQTAGWRAYGLSAAQYAAWLDSAVRVVQQHDTYGLVAGLALFNCGDYDE